MATTYSWVISSLECYPEFEGKKDVVFTVHWRRRAADGQGHNGDIYGVQAVTLDPLAPFTPYANLTAAQVEGWVASAMGASRIAALDADLAKRIADQIAPPVSTPPLPWA